MLHIKIRFLVPRVKVLPRINMDAKRDIWGLTAKVRLHLAKEMASIVGAGDRVYNWREIRAQPCTPRLPY
jgi:hypothetical protein